MKIIIDSREPEQLITYFKSLVDLSNIIIETDNLDIGDFQIYKNENSELPDIIIERKSIKDLLASLKDGRYTEQSYRLENYPLINHNIYYIIEGALEKISNKIQKQTVYSTLFTLNYFKGFSILNSLNINQTCEFIYRFSDKLLRETKRKSYYNLNTNNINNINNSNNSNNTTDYSSVLKSTKKSNITQNNILEIMLMQIPGVSANIAQIINKEFKTIKNLINCLENDKNCLDGLKININKERKISKNTIKNIITYLLNTEYSLDKN